MSGLPFFNGGCTFVAKVIRVLPDRLIVQLPMPGPESTINPTTGEHIQIFEEVEAWIDRDYARTSEMYTSSYERLLGHTPPVVPELDPDAAYQAGDRAYIRGSQALSQWEDNPIPGGSANLQYTYRYWAIGRAAPMPDYPWPKTPV